MWLIRLTDGLHINHVCVYLDSFRSSDAWGAGDALRYDITNIWLAQINGLLQCFCVCYVIR